MNEESRPLDGWPILLAHHERFVSSYLGRALTQAGAHVVGGHASEIALAAVDDWSGFEVCLVSARFHEIAERGLGRCGAAAPPLVVLTDDPAESVSGAVAVFTYPFACYQVVDALARLKGGENRPVVRVSV